MITVTAEDTEGAISAEVTVTLSVTEPLDDTAPTVTFNPANAGTDVDIDGTITITFNESVRKLDNSALESADLAAMLTLKETDAAGADVAFTATINAEKTVITITPDAELAISQDYYVAIAAQAEDAADNGITATNVTFTTRALISATLDSHVEQFSYDLELHWGTKVDVATMTLVDATAVDYVTYYEVDGGDTDYSTPYTFEEGNLAISISDILDHNYEGNVEITVYFDAGSELSFIIDMDDVDTAY